MMFRVLRRNAKVAWHCPEIRRDLAAYYGWHCVHVVVVMPVLAVSAVAVALEMLAAGVSEVAHVLWTVTGKVTVARRRAALERARRTMPADAVRRRLGEVGGQP